MELKTMELEPIYVETCCSVEGYTKDIEFGYNTCDHTMYVDFYPYPKDNNRLTPEALYNLKNEPNTIFNYYKVLEYDTDASQCIKIYNVIKIKIFYTEKMNKSITGNDYSFISTNFILDDLRTIISKVINSQIEKLYKNKCFKFRIKTLNESNRIISVAVRRDYLNTQISYGKPIKIPEQIRILFNSYIKEDKPIQTGNIEIEKELKGKQSPRYVVSIE